MSDPAAEGPGFFGKVPSHGDFVSRRLPPAFVSPWDDSLQEGMLVARERFGAQWLPLYLNAPVWCFAIGPHVYGPTAWAGVLIPGVDRVGRYFPFTIAQAVEAPELARQLPGAQGWFDRLTELALATLTPDFVLDDFDVALQAAGLSSGNHALAPWRLAVPGVPDDSFAALLIIGAASGQSIWWSEGSPAVPASVRTSAGTMNGSRFASLLDRGTDEWDRVTGLTSTVSN